MVRGIAPVFVNVNVPAFPVGATVAAVAAANDAYTDVEIMKVMVMMM